MQLPIDPGEYGEPVDTGFGDAVDPDDGGVDLPSACVAAVPHGTVSCPDVELLAQLIGRVVRQDEAALAALYDSLCGRVYAVALQITGQIACAEEVMQDTFWQVWRQAPRFDAARIGGSVRVFGKSIVPIRW